MRSIDGPSLFVTVILLIVLLGLIRSGKSDTETVPTTVKSVKPIKNPKLSHYKGLQVTRGIAIHQRRNKIIKYLLFLESSAVLIIWSPDIRKYLMCNVSFFKIDKAVEEFNGKYKKQCLFTFINDIANSHNLKRIRRSSIEDCMRSIPN